jgi:imidazolonepropionase-like amidohydrolase
MKKFFTYCTLFIISTAVIFMISYQTNLYVWEAPQQNMWIANGQLFDGTSEQAIKNPGILIEKGKIACLGRACKIPQEIIHIDATGKSIVPGLIDLHGHFFSAKAQGSEHGLRHGNLIKSETMQKIVENNIIYVPTLGREPQGHLNIAALNQSGVALGVGTDSPVEMISGNSYHHELSRMVNAGMPDVKALIAATRNGAKALGKSKELGTIEVGKYADILLIDGQPWQDITELKNIEMVILSGRIALDKLPVL